MFDIYLSLDQENREKQDLDAINNQQYENTDLYSEGWFDGVCGLEPSQIEKYIYWDAYQLGLREHWAKKLNVEIPTEF